LSYHFTGTGQFSVWQPAAITCLCKGFISHASGRCWGKFSQWSERSSTASRWREGRKATILQLSQLFTGESSITIMTQSYT